jgi:hypothetical protein
MVWYAAMKKAFVLLAFPLTFAWSGLAAAQETAARPNLNVEVVDHSWQKGAVWENFNRAEFTWSATVKNNNSDARHICINYEFLDENGLPVIRNSQWVVVAGGGQEGQFTGTLFVKLPVVEDVKTTRVIPLEAHPLHSFVRPPSQ